MALHDLTGTGADDLFGPFAFAPDEYLIDGAGGNDTVDASATSGRDFINIWRDGNSAALGIAAPNGTLDISVFSFTSVENLVVRTGRSVDVVDIGDITGLGINRITVDLTGPTGTGDVAPDQINADGTAASDTIRVSAANGVVTVTGLATQLVILGAEAEQDQLQLYGGQGDDVIDASGVFGLKASARSFFLSGDDGNDQIIGSVGGDRLAGGVGADTLIGGAGNDTYLNPAGDTIVETANGGVDTVISGQSFDLTLVAGVERLTLSGSLNTDGTGNRLDNFIEGNAGNNMLRGLAGSDTIVGGGGADTINGGAGVDLLAGGRGQDFINPGSDDVADIVRILKVNESSGARRDVVSGMDMNGEDIFHLGSMPTTVAGNVVGGVLNEATFDADLGAALGLSLRDGSAVLFDPSSGTADRPNSIFLVIDANGQDGYQARGDYVIELRDWIGTLDTSDFFGS